MNRYFFCSDLHGKIERYNNLFHKIREELPRAVFLGGDLLPMHYLSVTAHRPELRDFVNNFLIRKLLVLKETLKNRYPHIFVILGNDDPRRYEKSFQELTKTGILHYIHQRVVKIDQFEIAGYSYIPPTPFLLKDWERYDVGRYVDPGCISPEEGKHTLPVSIKEEKYKTIAQDLKKLAGSIHFENSIFLFHSPPYQTLLDRAALDGRMIDNVPVDIHVGSIAIRRFIETYQPYITLHGHVHESSQLTGNWKDRIGRTVMFNAAHNGPELSLIKFDPHHPEKAQRELI